MIRNILLALLGFVIVAFLILWLLNGGPRRAYVALKNFSFVDLSALKGSATPPLIPDYSFDNSDFLSETYTAEQELATLQREYESLVAETRNVQNLGNPSPLFGHVRIGTTYSSPDASNPAQEHIVLEAEYGNTNPISLAGWTIHSALTGNYTPIPGAASPFWMGAVNTVSPLSLEPGQTARITSGISPVGVSFRENMCTGYLSQFQTFNPPLSLQCPSPQEEVVLTTENLQAFGPECIDAVYQIPTCEFPQELSGVSHACRAHLQTILSYNGCVRRHSSDTQFSEGSWRLYAGSGMELWRNDHDALRLLDAEGRVVDVYVY